MIGFMPIRGAGATIGLASVPSQPPPALPPLQPHPLPPSLTSWQDPTELSDYFEAIAPTAAGYLIWSRFPIQVYVQPMPDSTAPDAMVAEASNSAQTWYEAVQQAIQEWQVYLPLAITAHAEAADITILRAAPPLQPLRPGNEPLIDRLPRVRSAESRYEILLRPSASAEGTATLIHRFIIYITPNQTAAYTLATARHELGHALGIWGHSPIAADALYFSQVSHPPGISSRDLNTLKRIYQQPTRLGWTFTASEPFQETDSAPAHPTSTHASHPEPPQPIDD